MGQAGLWIQQLRATHIRAFCTNGREKELSYEEEQEVQRQTKGEKP